MSKRYKGFYVKYSLLLSHFRETWISPSDIWKLLENQISWQSVYSEPRQSMRTDRQTAMTKLIVAFRNSTNSSKRNKIGLWTNRSKEIFNKRPYIKCVSYTVKLSLLCLEGIRRSGDISPLILNLSTRYGESPALRPGRFVSPYPFNERYVCPKANVDILGNWKTLLPLHEK